MIILAASNLVLIIIVLILLFKLKDKAKEIKSARTDAVKKSRASVEGRVFEQIVPMLPSFSHNPLDAHFIGNPIDYIIFNGLSTGNPTEIIFLEVKRGSGQLSTVQRKIKKLVEGGTVKWELLNL